MRKKYYVYILGNVRPTIYIGVTNNLSRRIYEHKKGLIEGFSTKYCLTKLLYFEEYISSVEAITREKQLKAWKRNWKLELIRKNNPSFKDLYKQII
jgi:putative endonuclease